MAELRGKVVKSVVWDVLVVSTILHLGIPLTMAGLWDLAKVCLEAIII